MKKVMFFVFCVFWAGSVLAQEYPNPTMEQVNINPEGYLGLTVKFLESEFAPNPTLFDAPKYFGYSTKFYTYELYSKGKISYFHGYFFKDEFDITFQSSQSLAVHLTDSGLDLKTRYKMNIICLIEKVFGKSTKEREEPYYLCKILKVEYVDDTGNIIAVYEDDGVLPSNPFSKWDVGLDGKIGLPEAIRALQVISGIRQE